MSKSHKRAAASKPHQNSLPPPKAVSTRGAGFWLAALLYFVLSFFSPLALRVPLWFGLTFGLLPVLIGFVAARGTAQSDTAGQRFHGAFWACGMPAWFYTIIKLGAALNGVGWTFSRILVWFSVACVYAAVAGIVAGLAGMLIFRQADQSQNTHNAHHGGVA